MSIEPFIDPEAPVQPLQYAYEFGVLLGIFKERRPARFWRLAPGKVGPFTSGVNMRSQGAGL